MSGPPATSPAHASPTARKTWLVLGPIICAVMGLVTATRLKPNENKLHDFVQEWTSARNWLQGEPIYEDLHQSVAADIRPDLVATLPIQYNAHPPASVLLTLPFGVLPYHESVVIWNLLSMAALVVSVALIIGPGGLSFPKWVWWPVASLLLLSSPLAHQIYMAQLNLVLLLLFTVTWRLDRAGHFAAAGACVGLAASAKIFPGFLFLYFLAQRRYSALVSGAITMLVLNALSLAVLGGQAWEDYVTVVMPAVAGFRAAWVNASITGFWAKLFDSANAAVIPLATAPDLAKVLTGVCCLALVGVMSWAMYRAADSARRDSAFAACSLATLLLSPIVWHHYYVILVLPLLILWRRLPRTSLVRGLLCAAIFLLAINPAWITGVDVPIPGPDGSIIRPVPATPLKSVTGLSFQFYTLLVLWGLGCAGCFRVSAEPSTQSSSSAVVADTAPQPVHA